VTSFLINNLNFLNKETRSSGLPSEDSSAIFDIQAQQMTLKLAKMHKGS
jgi:hypothetical protein